ncbi:MAG: chorismate synthase [Phycisphaerae bacterium]
MRIVVTGPKGAGKSTLAAALAERVGLQAIETDSLIEDLHARQGHERLSCRQIYRQWGQARFRQLERQAVRDLASRDWCIIVTGGSTMLDADSRRILRQDAVIILLTGPTELLWERATRGGRPPWLTGPDARERFEKDVRLRDELIRPFADVVLETSEDSPQALAAQAAEAIGRELAVRCRAANTYGQIIRMTTFGESHGPAVGAVLDGVRPGLEISPEDIQAQLQRRRPGQSAVTTARNEADQVHILSGIFEGKTTGAPIAMIIYNRGQDPSSYEALRDVFRPGHADFAYYRKYGLRDHRGGGRASGRETAARVACGAIARKILAERGVRIVAHAVEIAGIRARTCNYDAIETNPVRCADPEAARQMEQAILAARAEQDSVGGIVQLEIHGVPAGLGDPVFAKLDARLTAALMTIGATKGVEIGEGFALTRLRGSQSNDAMADGTFLSNKAGGVAGGISTGQPIVLRLAVKPTSSIGKPQRTIDVAGRNRQIEVHGRHDPCIVPRVIPVAESMAALVILDAWEIQSRLRPDWPDHEARPGRHG